jgi:hypothetical protein
MILKADLPTFASNCQPIPNIIIKKVTEYLFCVSKRHIFAANLKQKVT